MADDVQFDANWEDAVLKASRPLMRRVTRAIASDMLRLVPRDTGELANSIEEEEAGDDRYRVTVGTDHWAHVEYGTRHQTAQPFIRPAFLKKRSL
jgi:HK97 gp10 family phage protein